LKPELGTAALDDRAIGFGAFILRPAAHLPLEGETIVHIGARALDLLIVLVEQAGRMVTEDELTGRVWPESRADCSPSRIRRERGRKPKSTFDAPLTALGSRKLLRGNCGPPSALRGYAGDKDNLYRLGMDSNRSIGGSRKGLKPPI
jgi:hypothetical protein